MATKIQQILEAAPNESVLFGSWLSSQGLDARGQYAYMKSGWLDRISKGVYKIHGTEPTLLATVSSYNTQLDKSCVVGAYTSLELRGYSHYLSMGKPMAYLFTDKNNKLPSWLLREEWDMIIKYWLFHTLMNLHSCCDLRLQNNKKGRKKQLGEARKQVAEGATLKLVLEIQEIFGSVERLLSQKYDGKTVWLYVFPNVISLRSLLW